MTRMSVLRAQQDHDQLHRQHDGAGGELRGIVGDGDVGDQTKVDEARRSRIGTSWPQPVMAIANGGQRGCADRAGLSSQRAAATAPDDTDGSAQRASSSTGGGLGAAETWAPSNAGASAGRLGGGGGGSTTPPPASASNGQPNAMPSAQCDNTRLPYGCFERVVWPCRPVACADDPHAALDRHDSRIGANQLERRIVRLSGSSLARANSVKGQARLNPITQGP